MTVTCKYSRKVSLIPGKSTWGAKEWAVALLRRLYKTDWGIPKAIFSDRDRKFVAELWKEIFNQLGVNLLYSTAYHPQMDGSSERTNQTIEIALRFWIATLERPDMWSITLPIIQFRLNNTRSQALEKAPNEIAYGFTINDKIELVQAEKAILPLDITRIDAADAVAFAQIQQKYHYDKGHHPQFLRVGEWADLNLHKGYKIPTTSVIDRKYSQQRAGPMRVVERVGRLAYRLDIPDHWRVHPVFSIAQFEPAPAPDANPYNRPRPTNPPPVESEREQVVGMQEYNVEKLLDRRQFNRGRKRVLQYLVCWEGYRAQEDQWVDDKHVLARDLVAEYERHYGQRPADAPDEPAILRKLGRPRKAPNATDITN